jgi:rhodanese-related sulfurtransferase
LNIKTCSGREVDDEKREFSSSRIWRARPRRNRDGEEDKLRFHTDSWDLSVDLKAGLAAIVVIDARSREAYIAGHIPGAVSFPHREMNSETTARLDRGKVYVVYCDGIGCNASTKGAYKLARLGFRAKELLGGLDWWRRDGHPVAASDESGSLLAAAK